MRPFARPALLVVAFLAQSVAGAPPAAAQEASSVVVQQEPASAAQEDEASEGQASRFWPAAGAGLLGGAIGGGLGLLAGDIEIRDADCNRRWRSGRCDRDDDETPSIPAVIPGAWIGTTIGALAGARADIESNPGRVLLVGGTTVLGGAVGAGFGAALSGGRGWAGVSGAMLGAAGSAAFSLWAAARNQSSQRAALLNVGANETQFAVPAVERRRVPLTPQRGWNVPVLNVQF